MTMKNYKKMILRVKACEFNNIRLRNEHLG